MVIMTGTLHPSDSVPGCNFVVEEIGEDEYRVTLTSPYPTKEGKSEIVAQETMEWEAVGTWLYNQKDY